MFTLKTLFSKKRAAALTALAEIDQREAVASRNDMENSAHIEKRSAQLAAKAGLANKGERKVMNMIVPENYAGPSKPQARMEPPNNLAELNTLRAENSALKTRVSALESISQPKPPAKVDFEKLARKVFGDDQVCVWDRNTRFGSTNLSSHCAKVFFLHGLGDVVPGINVASMTHQHGAPRQLFGMERTEHARLRKATLDALSTTA